MGIHVGRAKPLDKEMLEPMRKWYREKQENVKWNHRHHKVYVTGCMENDKTGFWSKHPDLYKYLEENTFPYDAPIHDSWISYLSQETDNERNRFMFLHQDFTYDRPRNANNMLNDEDLAYNSETLLHVNSIILDTSEDMDGGELVLAGDSLESLRCLPQDRGKDTRDLLYRLQVVPARNIGDLTVWHGLTVHGVSELYKGWRSSLIIFKRSMYNEEDFKTGYGKDHG